MISFAIIPTNGLVWHWLTIARIWRSHISATHSGTSSYQNYKKIVQKMFPVCEIQVLNFQIKFFRYFLISDRNFIQKSKILPSTVKTAVKTRMTKTLACLKTAIFYLHVFQSQKYSLIAFKMS